MYFAGFATPYMSRLTQRRGEFRRLAPRTAVRPMCSASPEKRAKRIRKARDRLLEYVPHTGEFPTLAEVETALQGALAESYDVKSKPALLDSQRHSPGARIVEVCRGKACLRKGADEFATRLEELDLGGVPTPVMRCKCQDQCKEPGVTVRMLGDNGRWKTISIANPEDIAQSTGRADVAAGVVVLKIPPDGVAPNSF